MNGERANGGDGTRDRDRGEAVAQLVILTPLLVLLVFLGFQTAIYFHAANVAAAAAAQGAAAASPGSAGADQAADAAQAMVDDLDGHTTTGVAVGQTDGFVTVTVTIEVAHIVPFFPDTVSRTALEPKERFIPESDR